MTRSPSTTLRRAKQRAPRVLTLGDEHRIRNAAIKREHKAQRLEQIARSA